MTNYFKGSHMFARLIRLVAQLRGLGTRNQNAMQPKRGEGFGIGGPLRLSRLFNLFGGQMKLTMFARTISYSMIALAGLMVSSAVRAQDGEAAAKASGCLVCHAIDKQKMGPAYKNVAMQFKGDPDAVAKLTGIVTEGKKHPKVSASADQVKTIVSWILTLGG